MPAVTPVTVILNCHSNWILIDLSKLICIQIDLTTSRLTLPWLQLIMSTVASSMSFGFPGYRQQCFITGLAIIYVYHVTCNLYFCILWFLNVRCWKINLLLLLLTCPCIPLYVISISNWHPWIIPNPVVLIILICYLLDLFRAHNDIV